VDDQGSRGPARRPDDDQIGDEQAPETDQDYYWGGKPGEDFGPIAPPGPRPTSGERRPLSPLDGDDETIRTASTRLRSTEHGSTLGGEPLRPDGVFTQPARRHRWRPIVTAFGALLVLSGLTAAVLFVISRQGVLGLMPGAPIANPSSTPAPAIASPVPPATQSPTAASSAVAAPPTPLTLGAPSPSPAPVRSPASRPTARPSPAILPTPPALVTPPGLRFPTSTPARLSTPQLFRTPPPIPSPRLPTVSTRVWSDQVIHRVGEDASICGQTSSGSSAQLVVIAPDRSTRTLGEFATPTERVCYSVKVDQPELWVLTLIIKDASGAEIDRQSAALWVSR
jgi:hypothetical protein